MSGFQPESLLARLLAADTYADQNPRPTTPHPRTCDHWTSPILLERIAYLRKLARAGDGAATDALNILPGHHAELWVRLRTTPPGLYDQHALMLFALDGRATLLTGGALEQQKRLAPGHWTGHSLAGAQSGTQITELRPGDVVHIPAATPHQLVVTMEKGFACLVLRLRIIDEQASAKS